MTSNLKGAVVVNAYWRGGDEGAEKVAQALQALGASVDLLRASEIDLGVGTGLTGSFPYDYVVFLDKDDHLARLLEKSGARLFNSAESIRLADDKMLTHIALTPLPQPETISSPLFFAGEDDEKFLAKKFRYLGEMCVAGFDEGIADLMSPLDMGASINASLGTIAANVGDGLGIAAGNSQTFNFYDTQTSPDAIRRKVQNTMTFGLAGGI